MPAVIFRVHFGLKSSAVVNKVIEKYPNWTCHVQRRNDKYYIIRHGCLMACKYCDQTEILRETEKIPAKENAND